MKLGLAVYGTTFMMGIHPQAKRPRIKASELLDQAAQYGLQGIELPLSLLEGEDAASLARTAQARGHYLVIASGGYDPQPLKHAIEAAARLGAKVVRTVVGGADFGGDRRRMAGRWHDFMQEVLAGLGEAARAAEQAGVTLAVENHQDLASEELIWLCEEIGSPSFGITLDTGNPLATAEEPVEFAKRIGPHLKHVHLKDYWIYLSDEGYRLVRCPLGQGAVDFSALFDVFAVFCPEVSMSMELGALEARHTRVLCDDYWRDYPPRSASQLAKLLRFVQAEARPAGDWRTPYEKRAPEEDVAAYEQRQLLSSLAYMQHTLQERSRAIRQTL
ncbi:sugar phosphate isomerase/epimerase family protein [Paenibacillus sp. GCM10023248]|uniref:sugar phosphate isomerase/epimerase family protein n=1 Tax=Bacillales TaxID=1385 RepID=UPI0023790413|nr:MULTISPECIES: sugar phosphate isomerase/epimerase family protein [Bacillales]MDD9267032.1 sugar phosphate isomerase/epimerase [Paenibacillus sp. MAHUQ-63]MDR6881233.1 sugar phosphate isomerase/epimerase [Bacillus sp. 3255]